MANIFVGAGRKALVSGIVERLDNLTDYKGDSSACLISLEAPSGWGKTRIIQEVYKQVAERQSSAYWPNSIIPEDEDDPVSRRKHLVPSFVEVARDRKVLPEFFWWGLTCDMRSTNMLSRTLMEDIEQLRFHAPYLEAAWAASKLTRLGKYATIAKAKSALSALFEEGAVTGLSKLADLGLGATPFGIGLGLKLVTSGVKAAKVRKDENEMMQQGFEAHQSADENLVDETVHLFSRLAHKDLPIIVCIEDIHKATCPVLEMIAKLVVRNAPILILTTTWPGEFEKIIELNELLDASWAQDRILRMEYDKPAPKGLPENASLSQLPPEDLGEIILARYPKAENKAVKLLTERYKNPLPLELVLNMKSLKQDYPWLELDIEDVEDLPETVRDLYNSLWNELPEPVRQLLALSTELMPEGQPEWLMSLITDVTRQLADEQWAKEISQIAANDNVPHGWARVVEGWLRRFGEADQFDIARAHVKELFGKRQLRQFNETVAQQINEFDFENTAENNSEAIHKAWLSMVLHKANKISLDTYLSAGLYLLQTMSDSPLEWPKAIKLGEDLISQKGTINNLSNKQRDIIIWIQYQRASICGESGDIKTALHLSNDALNECQFLHGSDHPNILNIRTLVAHNLGKSGAVLRALEACQELLKDQIRIIGRDHPNVLITRSHIAYWLGQSGAISEALESYQELLKDETRILGTDHRNALTTRNNIAGWLAVSEAFEALEAWKELLKDQIRILGIDHPDVLITRNNIAVCLAESGAVSEALEAFPELLKDRTRILGMDHPDVLITRNNIAVCLAESGAVLEALEAFKELLKDQTRILGTDHPDVLTTRGNVSAWLGQSGAVSEALQAFEELLIDQTRILGADHPDALTTRNNIAYFLGQNGAVSEALEAFKDLFEDQARVSGACHPNTIKVKDRIKEFQDKLSLQDGENENE